MSRLPSVNATEVLAALAKAGFYVARQRGSHVVVRHTDGRGTVVPMHKGEDIDRRLLAGILRDAGLSAEEFREFLR